MAKKTENTRKLIEEKLWLSKYEEIFNHCEKKLPFVLSVYDFKELILHMICICFKDSIFRYSS